MSIDIDEMVRMAKERKGWNVANRRILNSPYISNLIVDLQGLPIAELIGDPHSAKFIAQSPQTIAYLGARVKVLEAQNAALQARVEALGEWQGVEVVPPLITDEVITVLSGTTYTQSGYVEALTPVKAYYEVTTMPNGEVETRWVLCLIEREVAVQSVVAWRPLPESPTAAE